jgi:hypothetical protein
MPNPLHILHDTDASEKSKFRNLTVRRSLDGGFDRPGTVKVNALLACIGVSGWIDLAAAIYPPYDAG